MRPRLQRRRLLRPAQLDCWETRVRRKTLRRRGVRTASHLAATRRAVPLTRPPPPRLESLFSQRRGRCRFDDARSMRCDDGSDCGPCVCNAGWTGIDCTQHLCPGSCSGHGWCTDAGCQCYPGFEGRDCAQPTCPRNCSGHGTCEMGRCRCEAGWADADCRLPAHPFRSTTATRIWMPASNSLREAPGTAPGSVESDG